MRREVQAPSSGCQILCAGHSRRSARPCPHDPLDRGVRSPRKLSLPAACACRSACALVPLYKLVSKRCLSREHLHIFAAPRAGAKRERPPGFPAAVRAAMRVWMECYLRELNDISCRRDALTYLFTTARNSSGVTELISATKSSVLRPSRSAWRMPTLSASCPMTWWCMSG